MAPLITIVHLVRALALKDFDSAVARQGMAPAPRGWQKRAGPPFPAAVVILVFPTADGSLNTVLTLRTAELRGHSGQVSFPGGRQEPQDENLTETALRETCEEIGVCAERLSIIGQFPPLYIPASHHEVCPIIAHFDGKPAFARNPDEVAEVFAFALEDLLRREFKRVEQRRIRGIDVRAPFYDVRGRKVWGATAMLLSELEGRLRRVLPPATLLELA